MDTNKLLDGIAEGTLTRRELNKALTALGIGMVTLPVLSKTARAAREVMYFGWAGYENTSFHPSYIEKYGGSPDATFWATEDEAFQKMRMGGFVPDVMHPCTYEIIKWQDAGMLQPLDTSRLEHLPDMFRSLDDIEGSVIDGKRYFMPMDWGNSTVIYRTDLVDPEDAGDNLSWDILYEEKYKNRIAFYDSSGAVVEIAGLLLGYDNIFSLTDEQLVEVRKVVEKQRDNLRFYWGDQSEIEQALASGELVAGHSHSMTRTRASTQQDDFFGISDTASAQARIVPMAWLPVLSPYSLDEGSLPENTIDGHSRPNWWRRAVSASWVRLPRQRHHWCLWHQERRSSPPG